MNKDEIVAKVRALDLPDGSYVVFGSCPLAAAGLRPANDIDMLVSPATQALLKTRGWQEIEKNADDRPLVHDVFEAHIEWSFSSYRPTLEQLLATADLVDGVPFAALEEVRRWKIASGRPKDVDDVRLIDAHRDGTRPTRL